MRQRIREYKPGVVGLSEAIWWTDFGDSVCKYTMYLFYNFHPKAEYVTVLERTDGEPFDISPDGKKIRLTSNELVHLHKAVGDMDWTILIFERCEQAEPFWPLREAGFFPKK